MYAGSTVKFKIFLCVTDSAQFDWLKLICSNLCNRLNIVKNGGLKTQTFDKIIPS